TQRLQESLRLQKEETQREHNEAWNGLVARWREGLAEVQATVDEIHREEDVAFFDWNKAGLEDWQYPSPTTVPPGLRFGDFTVPMSQIPSGIPSDARLKEMVPSHYTLPAILPFPTRGSLLIKAGDTTGKAEATSLLQAMMLRF